MADIQLPALAALEATADLPPRARRRTPTRLSDPDFEGLGIVRGAKIAKHVSSEVDGAVKIGQKEFLDGIIAVVRDLAASQAEDMHKAGHKHANALSLVAKHLDECIFIMDAAAVLTHGYSYNADEAAFDTRSADELIQQVKTDIETWPGAPDTRVWSSFTTEGIDLNLETGDVANVGSHEALTRTAGADGYPVVKVTDPAQEGASIRLVRGLVHWGVIRVNEDGTITIKPSATLADVVAFLRNAAYSTYQDVKEQGDAKRRALNYKFVVAHAYLNAALDLLTIAKCASAQRALVGNAFSVSSLDMVARKATLRFLQLVEGLRTSA